LVLGNGLAVEIGCALKLTRFQIFIRLIDLGPATFTVKQICITWQCRRTKVNQANEYLKSGQFQRAADLYREAIAKTQTTPLRITISRLHWTVLAKLLKSARSCKSPSASIPSGTFNNQLGF